MEERGVCYGEDGCKAGGSVKRVGSQSQKQDHGNGLARPEQEDNDLPSTFRQCAFNNWIWPVEFVLLVVRHLLTFLLITS